MSAPQTLSRPLAARVAGLPQPPQWPAGPDISPATIQAAADALDAGKTHYTDRPGILPLRVWVTDLLKERFGLALTPDDVTVTCGGTEARFVALKQLVRPGTAIVCPGNPAPIAAAAHLVGAPVLAQADNPGAVSLAYLTPRDAQIVVEALLAQATAKGWWIVWDISGTAGPGFHPAQDAALAPRVVTIGSLSDRLPGWRMGWMAGSERAGKLRAYKQSMTICSMSIAQWAALGMVSER